MEVTFKQIVDNIRNPLQKYLVEQEEPDNFVFDAQILDIAPNVIEWTVGKDWLGNPSTYKHVRQYQILRDFFQIRCPICNSLNPEAMDCWGKGQEYLESEVLLVWSSKYKDEVCPKCGSTKQELGEDGLLIPYDRMVGCAGMRSGKSVTAAIGGSFVEHRVVTWPEPLQKYIELIEGQPIQISYVASTATQVKETVWAAYMALRDKSPWFAKYAAWAKAKEKEQIVPQGKKAWKYEEGTNQVEYGHLSLIINNLNSNSSGIAGRTRILAVIDELSRFNLTESKMSADEVYRVLNNSLQTVRGAKMGHKLPPWFGMMISISSPISVEDKTMQLLKKAPYLEKMYSFHYATWDFNPFQKREYFEDEYNADPIAAERDFGANPPLAENPLIDDVVRFEKALDPTLTPTVIFRDTKPKDELGREYVGKEVSFVQLDTQFVHHLFFDAGSSFDSFAAASAHGEWIDVKDMETGGIIRSFIVVYDWIMSIRPLINPSRTVYYDCIVKMVDDINKRQMIGSAGFDRWNSEALIQAIRNLKVHAGYYSLKYNDFQNLTSQTYLGRVKLLPRLDTDDETADPRVMSDQGKAVYELTKLQKSLDLKKVYNPNKGKVQGVNSDDLAHVVTGAHKLVVESIVQKEQTTMRERLKREMSSQTVGVWTGQQSVVVPGAGIVNVGNVPAEDAYAIGPETPGRISDKLTTGDIGTFRRW